MHQGAGGCLEATLVQGNHSFVASVSLSGSGWVRHQLTLWCVLSLRPLLGSV